MMYTETAPSEVAVANAAVSASASHAVDIEKLYREHCGHLSRFVRRYVRSPEDADDVVQITFMEAMRCAHHFSGLSKPSTWLYGIAINIARTYARRNYCEAHEEMDETMLEQLVDTGADPQQLTEMRDIVAKVEALLLTMPARIRDTFEAVLDEDTTYEKAAERLHIPVGTVRSRVSRVRATVRGQLA